MKEIILGIGMTLIPTLIAMFIGEKKQKAIGRLISKWLRRTIGKPLEQIAERFAYNVCVGMMEDNDPDKAIAIEKAKKTIEDIRDSSPI